MGRKDGATLSKVIMELPGVKTLMYPPNIRSIKQQSEWEKSLIKSSFLSFAREQEF